MERLKQTGLLLGAHADARVADLKAQPQSVVATRRHFDGDDNLADGGELDRVAGQIEQNLAESQRIADQAVGGLGSLRQQNFQAFFLGLEADDIEQIGHDLAQIELDVLQRQLARLDLRKIENVVEDAEQGARRGVQFLQVIALLRRQFGMQHKLRQTDDGVHRRANLMAHIGEKVAFGLRRGVRCDLGGFEFLIDRLQLAIRLSRHPIGVFGLVFGRAYATCVFAKHFQRVRHATDLVAMVERRSHGVERARRQILHCLGHRPDRSRNRAADQPAEEDRQNNRGSGDRQRYLLERQDRSDLSGGGVRA